MILSQTCVFYNCTNNFVNEYWNLFHTLLNAFTLNWTHFVTLGHKIDSSLFELNLSGTSCLMSNFPRIGKTARNEDNSVYTCQLHLMFARQYYSNKTLTNKKYPTVFVIFYTCEVAIKSCFHSLFHFWNSCPEFKYSSYLHLCGVWIC